MTRGWRKWGLGRRWLTTLAALALAMQVLVPQGFMLGADAGAPGLVICTGHGPLLSLGDHGKPAKAPKASDAYCAIAALGGGAPPPVLTLPPGPAFTTQAPALARPLVSAPGRGLAAPPPPAQAPPTGRI
jgi:hypothetical protein